MDEKEVKTTVETEHDIKLEENIQKATAEEKPPKPIETKKLMMSVIL